LHDEVILKTGCLKPIKSSINGGKTKKGVAFNTTIHNLRLKNIGT
jgi:hypothetical protein